MPLWVANGQPSERARDAIAHLRTIDADGLDPADYPLPELAASSVDAAAEAELQVHRDDAHLCAPRHERPRALQPRQPEHRLQGQLRRRRRDGQDRRRRPTCAARSTASIRSIRATRRSRPSTPRCATSPAEPSRRASPHGPVLKYGRDKNGRETFMLDPRVPQLRERLGLPADADNRYDRALVDAVAKFQKANGLTANGQLDRRDHRRAQRPEPREADGRRSLATLERWRWMPRNLGTHARRAQHPGLPSQGDEQRRAGLEDPRRGRQADAGDAAAHRDDEVHHRQSDLERAAVDHLQRAAADLRDDRPARSSPAWASRSSASRTARSACSSRRASATRSAASGSTSRTSSWSTSTTRRRSTTSRTTSAPTATAACACRIR